jgi:peptidoglycan L-alanyl-D-glutamate endopeptidase CwlK
VLGIAKMMGLDIRWGGDWNGDFNLQNQNFYDLPHYEVRE